MVKKRMTRKDAERFRKQGQGVRKNGDRTVSVTDKNLK
jgi:hypothetical protein